MRALFLLILLATVPVSIAQGDADELSLAGEYKDARLRITIHNPGEALAPILVVDHRDEAGVILDRAMRIELPARSDTHVSLFGLMSSYEHRLRLADPSHPLPEWSHARVIDSTRIDALPSLAEASATWAEPHAGIADAPARSIARLTGNAEAFMSGQSNFVRLEPKLLVTSGGLIVAGWEDGGRLAVAISRDGGHSFEGRGNFGVQDPLGHVWSMGETTDGRVQIIDYSISSGERWRIAVTDFVAAPSFTAEIAMPEDPVVNAGVPGQVVVPVPEGGGLTARPRYAGAQEPTPYGWDLWRVPASGTAMKLFEWPSTEMMSAPVVAVHGEHIAIVALTTSINVSSRPLLFRSDDGGATFDGPLPLAEMEAIIRDAPTLHDYRPSSLLVDEQGIVHATFSVPGRFEGGSQSNGYYVRVDGPEVSTTQFNDIRETYGQAQNALSPTVARAGDRLTLAWSVGGPSTIGDPTVVVQQSADRGITWGPAIPIRTDARGAIRDVELGVFPDGRPVLGGRAPDPSNFHEFERATALHFGVVIPFDPRPEELDRLHTRIRSTSLTGEPLPEVYSPLDRVRAEPLGTVSIPRGRAAHPDVTLVQGHSEPVRVVALKVFDLPRGVIAFEPISEGVTLGVGERRSFVMQVEDNINGTSGVGRMRLVFDDGTLGEPYDVPIVIGSARVDDIAQLPPPLWLGIAAAAAAVVAAFAALRSDWLKLLAGLALAPLYTRTRRSDVLKHTVRTGVYEHVRAHPGVRYEEMRRALGLSNGALAFHLRVLVREGYVTTRTKWTRTNYYATDAPRLPASDDSARETIARLLAQERMSPSQVAERLGISRQLARYHLRALEREGRVHPEGTGGGLLYGSRPRG